MADRSLSSNRKSLLDLPIDPITRKGLVAAIEDVISNGGRAFHASLNAAKVVSATTDDRLKTALWDFDFVTADGQSIVWAARLLGLRVPERIAGIDLMERIIERAAVRGWRIYLLGARPEIVALATDQLVRRFPNLIIAGTRHGYFDRDEEEEIVRGICTTRADVLFVALGSPEKEFFLERNRDVLGVAFGMGVGGAFDVVAGVRGRAPKPLQRAGLEWVYRLSQEPVRLGSRYFSSNRRFLGLVAKDLLALHRARRRRESHR
jgi:N-acetylglucosaminyldiphosphoundecaprenol N-acetyl-beta-D-mannosaminyltransferase